MADSYDPFANAYDPSWDVGLMTPYPATPTPAAVSSAASSGNWAWLSDALSKAPQLITGITAYQLSQINVERARSGLPPLNAAAYGPQVGLSVAPQTMQTIMMIALGLGAFMLLSRR